MRPPCGDAWRGAHAKRWPACVASRPMDRPRCDRCHQRHLRFRRLQRWWRSYVSWRWAHWRGISLSSRCCCGATRQPWCSAPGELRVPATSSLRRSLEGPARARRPPGSEARLGGGHATASTWTTVPVTRLLCWKKVATASSGRSWSVATSRIRRGCQRQPCGHCA